MLKLTEDVLAWEKFYEVFEKGNFHLPQKIELFNRLVAHSKNFFAISAIGAFTPGYLLIITKKLLPSFAFIEKNHIKEMNWFIKSICNALEETYNRKTVLFEHGMCACIGGLDRAHTHLMTLDKKINDKTIINSINNTLNKRKAGIKYIKYKKFKLENIHDINQIMDSPGKNSYKTIGKLLSHDKIKNNFNLSQWPLTATKHAKNGGQYVYFKTPSKLSSFFTNKNFHTQLGREILFDVEIKTNKKLKMFADFIISKNTYANLWKWQEFPYEANMIQTMHDIAPLLLKIKDSPEAKLYNFETFRNF